MFKPKPQGLGNPCFKHISVREYNSPEARLFDKVYEVSATKKLNPSVMHLMSSIIELRDLQAFLRDDVRCLHDDHVNSCLEYIGEGLAYYINRMHETDAKIFAVKCPTVLYQDMTNGQLNEGLYILHQCIESACKVNCAVITMAIKG